MIDLMSVLAQQYWHTNPLWRWLVPTDKQEGYCRYSFVLLPQQRAELLALGYIAVDGELTLDGLAMIANCPVVKDSIEHRRSLNILEFAAAK